MPRKSSGGGLGSLPIYVIILFVGVLFFFLLMVSSTQGVNISSDPSSGNYSVYAAPFEFLNTAFSTSMYIWIAVALVLAVIFLVGVVLLAKKSVGGKGSR